MPLFSTLILMGLGAGFALLLGWFAWGRPMKGLRSEAEALKGEIASVREARMAAEVKLAAAERGEAERERAFAEQMVQLKETQESLTKQFEQLAAAALRQSQAQFLEVATQTFEAHKQKAEAGLEKNKAELKALLTPVQETLKRYEEGLKAVELAREQAYGGLKEQIEAVRAGQLQVREETAKLVNALRSNPKMRGRWGEQQCRNVLEMAGLKEGVDYRQEVSLDVDDTRQRPDFVVNLPGGKCLVIDAKCSFNAYIDAVEAIDDGTRRMHLAAHALSVRSHADGLSKRSYWQQFENTPDFVVMFIPGEHFLSAALEQEPTLWEWAFDKRVLLATPTNLVAIAKTVAATWRQEKLADDARAIGELGRELHQRLATMGEHLQAMGKNLNQAVASYNKFISSLDSRVMPQARKFLDLNVEPGAKRIEHLAPVETVAREPSSVELLIAPEPKVAAAE